MERHAKWKKMYITEKFWKIFSSSSTVKWKCTWVSKIFLEHFLWYVWHFCGRNSFPFLSWNTIILTCLDCSFVTTFCGQITQPLIKFLTFCVNWMSLSYSVRLSGMNERLTEWRRITYFIFFSTVFIFKDERKGEVIEV